MAVHQLNADTAPISYACYLTSKGDIGCCPVGQNCNPPVCPKADWVLCPDQKFCCPAGYVCDRDNSGNVKCRDPNPPPPPPTPPPPPPSPSPSPPPPPPPPPTPKPSTVTVTQTAILTMTQTFTASSTAQSTSRPTAPGETSSGTTTVRQAAETDSSSLGSETKINTGAVAGGVTAGAIIVVGLVVLFIIWRRRKNKETPTAGPQSSYPPASPQFNQYNAAGVVPPTPGRGDPFLTPMGQHQNFGASYFNGAAPGIFATAMSSGSHSGSSPPNTSQYSGLPELQQANTARSNTPMLVPRSELHQPRPLAMSVERIQRTQSSDIGNVARPWSAYAPSPGTNPAPYAESNNSQPSAWAAQTGYASPPYADHSGPGRPASTVYQPSSHVAYSPPGSPAFPEAYGSMTGPGKGGGGGLPPGAASPVNVHGSDMLGKQSLAK
ncbi:hypothetical protein FRC12_017134 [Ceratobasidium sp. 428]|nr:hypothetical protein FRC12_017134 [Ceratobasidium sp. 428]